MATLRRTIPASCSLVSNAVSSTSPSALNNNARLVSTSNPASGALTSLATMRSTRLAASLAAAPATAAAWEAWLAKNHARSTGVWLRLPKGAGESLTYAAAVEAAMIEAECQLGLCRWNELLFLIAPRRRFFPGTEAEQ